MSSNLSKIIEWSDYQKKIFDFVKTGDGNGVIEALAGSAKTSSLVESLNHLPKDKKAVVLCFNKSIQEELKTKVPKNVEAMTLHSLGYRAILKKFGKVTLEFNKTYDIIDTVLSPKENEVSSEMNRAVSLCKATISDYPAKVEALIDKYNIDFFPMDKQTFIEKTLKVLELSKKDTYRINYDDMIYFPVVFNLPLGKYDAIFGDECQDWNITQIYMIKQLAKPTSRYFIFLDEFQCIYSWRSADVDAVKMLIDSLNAKKFSLPITYRCDKAIVKEAKKYVPTLESRPLAGDGKVIRLYEKEFLSSVKPNDMVLSRTNAPLIKYCLMKLKEGVPSFIAGKDIGAGFTAFIKKSKAKSIDKFIDYVVKWKGAEIGRLMKEKKPIDSATDKAECLIGLCDGLTSISELKERVEKLFSDNDDKKKIFFSTVHRAKGLERDRVFILNFSFFAKDSSQEEKNISYVAITRAKKELFFVSKKKEEKDKQDQEDDKEELADIK